MSPFSSVQQHNGASPNSGIYNSSGGQIRGQFIIDCFITFGVKFLWPFSVPPPGYFPEYSGNYMKHKDAKIY